MNIERTGSVFKQIDTEVLSLKNIAAAGYLRIFDKLNDGSALSENPRIHRSIQKLASLLDLGTVTADKKRELKEALTQIRESAQKAAMVYVYNRKKTTRYVDFGTQPGDCCYFVWSCLNNGLDSFALKQSAFTIEALLVLRAHHDGFGKFEQLCTVHGSDLLNKELSAGNTSHQNPIGSCFSLAKDIANETFQRAKLWYAIDSEDNPVIPDDLKSISSTLYRAIIHEYLDSMPSDSELIQDLREFIQSPFTHTRYKPHDVR